jgi:sterol desaturase/sphingolipid hydroxylase (fatty acid hydroxylase superfamily)
MRKRSVLVSIGFRDCVAHRFRELGSQALAELQTAIAHPSGTPAAKLLQMRRHRLLPDEQDPAMAKMPGWLSAALTGGVFLGLVLLELRRPLRKTESEPKLRRNVRNMAVAGASAVAIMLTAMPVTAPLTRFVQRRRWGLVKWRRLPLWVEVPIALGLLDYTLYLWHVSFHRVPVLWRFHQVHHVDLDMDTSTALRFHFGEMALSTALQIFQILAIGVSPFTFSIWNTWLLCEIAFHHSNVELPFAVERWLCRFIVTPRMHGIHHSIVPEELNSNWSSGLTIWDWLHGTLRLNVPQNHLTLGVAAYPEVEQVVLPKLMEMPFDQQPPAPWVRPAGTVPYRDERLAPNETKLVPEEAPLPPDSPAIRRF